MYAVGCTVRLVYHILMTLRWALRCPHLSPATFPGHPAWRPLARPFAVPTNVAVLPPSLPLDSYGPHLRSTLSQCILASSHSTPCTQFPPHIPPPLCRVVVVLAWPALVLLPCCACCVCAQGRPTTRFKYSAPPLCLLDLYYR